jgi:hypothetical protein
MVRSKFTVTNIDPEHGGVTIKLTAVTSGSPENAQFFAYTPSGAISLSTVNTNASAQFEVGKEYYVDFTPASE